MVGWAGVLQILLGFACCALTSLSLGVALLRRLRVELLRAEALCLGYLVGSAAISTITLALAASWMARRSVFLALAATATVLLWRERRWVRDLKPVFLAQIPLGLRVLFGLALVVYGVLYFRQALSPEMSPDGMGYHLGFVNQWSHDHGLSRNISWHATKPQGMEMLFLFAFSIGGHSAAALVHFSFLAILPCLMVLLGHRFGWPPAAGIVAAILVFASPLLGVDGTAAYNDVAVAAVVFGAVYLLQIWRQAHARECLFAAALLAGFSVAIKPTAAVFGLFVVVVAAWEMRRHPGRRAAGALATVALIAVAVPAPYLIRNTIWFQNPLGSFGNAIFVNRWFHISFERSYARSQEHLGGIAWRDLPRELTFGGTKMQESFGPAFILLPLALIGLRLPRTRFLLAAAAAAALPFCAIKSARFLIPALPLATLAATFVLCRWRAGPIMAAGLAFAHLLVSLPAINNRFHISTGWRLAYHVPWRTALRQAPEEQCLARSDEYRMARLIEERVPEGGAVLSLDGAPARSYTLRPIFVWWESAFAERMADLILTAGNAPIHGSRVWTSRLPQVRAIELRIAQTGRGAGDSMWSINEVRLRSEGAELPRRSAWELRALPNPWDVELAFDGVEATRWRSWDTLRPGMWIDVRFDKPHMVDTVEVVCHDPQWESQMTASVLSETGEWKTADSSQWQSNIAPSDLRKQATRELRRAGIRYIELKRDAWRREPFFADGPGWGVREVASSNPSVLLSID